MPPASKRHGCRDGSIGEAGGTERPQRATGGRAAEANKGGSADALHLPPSLPQQPSNWTSGQLPRRHPEFRLALTVPWIGKKFPPWFPYFLSSCRRSAFLADWLIFHEGASYSGQQELPPNVLLFDIGKDGLGRLFGTKLAEALGDPARTAPLVRLFQTAFREFAYIVTEYKPTHGTVFADYLQGYSHWSYTDIDMLIGDLPLFIEREELEAYHIFSYHFGDVYRTSAAKSDPHTAQKLRLLPGSSGVYRTFGAGRPCTDRLCMPPHSTGLYLRGQFAAHQNRREVNLLWTRCAHLSSGLQAELEYKHRIVQSLAKQGKRGRTRFISAEGCYSWVVATAPGLRVKFASKAFADWSDDRYFYVVDGAVRKCPQPTQVWRDPTTSDERGEAEDDSRAQAVDRPSPSRQAQQECEPFGPRIAPHSLRLEGVQRAAGSAQPLQTHANCSRWVDEKWRVCAALEEDEAPLYNVLLREGSWWAQRFTSRQPARSLEGAFLHLQRWKGRYKKLRYGEDHMPSLRGRRLFRLSAKGLAPVDMVHDDERGASSALLQK